MSDIQWKAGLPYKDGTLMSYDAIAQALATHVGPRFKIGERVHWHGDEEGFTREVLEVIPRSYLLTPDGAGPVCALESSLSPAPP